MGIHFGRCFSTGMKGAKRRRKKNRSMRDPTITSALGAVVRGGIWYQIA